MFEPQNLVVNPTSGTVHRKTCGSVRTLAPQMFTLPAKFFLSIGKQRDYSIERGWRECRSCVPFIGCATPIAARQAGKDEQP